MNKYDSLKLDVLFYVLINGKLDIIMLNISKLVNGVTQGADKQIC